MAQGQRAHVCKSADTMAAPRLILGCCEQACFHEAAPRRLLVLTVVLVWLKAGGAVHVGAFACRGVRETAVPLLYTHCCTGCCAAVDFVWSFVVRESQTCWFGCAARSVQSLAVHAPACA